MSYKKLVYFIAILLSEQLSVRTMKKILPYMVKTKEFGNELKKRSGNEIVKKV